MSEDRPRRTEYEGLVLLLVAVVVVAVMAVMVAMMGDER